MNNPDELVVYLVVNVDLGMSIGKLLAQAMHAQRRIDMTQGQSTIYQEWIGDPTNPNEVKVILAGHQKDLDKLAAFGWLTVHDQGRTEIPTGSLTVVTSGVVRRADVASQVKRLQVLKTEHITTSHVDKGDN